MWSHRLMVLSIALWTTFLFSCEDPGILQSDQNFTRSRLQTVYVDTFSVLTSTILIDSLPTSGNGVLLLGSYLDPFLGKVSASTYFQVGYTSAFAPDQSSSFDSIGLILPYSRYFYGDTTKLQTISIHQLTSLPIARVPKPYRTDENISFFVAAGQPALYNTSTVSFNPTPITSISVKFNPHRDSLYIRLPKSLGQGWFDIAKADALAGSSSYFNNVNRFISELFNGIYISSDGTPNASIVGFRASKIKMRIYYKKLFGDLLQQTHFDFPLGNAPTQFNNIVSDRSGTLVSSLVRRGSVPSSATGNATYIQSGVGLATKVEFPTLKSFFSNKNLILIDAALEIVPVQTTYPKINSVPNELALYLTDQSNVLLNKALSFDRSSYLSTAIVYDYEFGINTKYSFPLVNFLSSELRSQQSSITPLAIASPPPAFFSEVNRVVVGDQHNLQSKIKLKIYYSYVPNQ